MNIEKVIEGLRPKLQSIRGVDEEVRERIGSVLNFVWKAQKPELRKALLQTRKDTVEEIEG